MATQLLNTKGAKQRPFSLVGVADEAWNVVRDAAFNTAWKPLTTLAESAVVALMQRITTGELRVLTYSQIYTFGSAAQPPSGFKAELRVADDVFWVRLCAMSDLGFAESYMYGNVRCDDLVSLFQIFLQNRQNLAGLDSRLSYLFTLPQKLTSYRFLNTIGNSRSNISAHYDISNAMFAGFLSEDMTYSCAIFDDLDGDLKQGDQAKWNGSQHLHRISTSSTDSEFPTTNPTPTPTTTATDPLHTAQLKKLHHIITKAHIQPHHRVLEIGTGWGSLAILIAQLTPNTTIDTLTLSSAQQSLAQSRIAALGLTHRITVHLMDYRAMPAEWEGAFDRVVSVEMVEAVGREYLRGYWGVVDWCLDGGSGVGVVQVITIPEGRFGRYVEEVDFIRKWIFPGGFLPTLTFLMETLEQGAKGRLVVDSVSNIGPHYARTLREWRRRFLDRFEDVIVPALQAEHPEVMTGPRGREEIEVFKRKWIYYYCYCEVGFTTRTLGDHIITFVREGHPDYGCTVFE